MDDLLDALLQPIRELFDSGNDDGGDAALPSGGRMWIIILTTISLVGATLLWLWLA